MSDNAPNHISDTQLWDWLRQEQEPGLEMIFTNPDISVPLSNAINLNILFELKTINHNLQKIARSLENE